MTFRAFMVSEDNALDPAFVNSREWRAAEIPAANGHGNGRALARIYGALARGGALDGVQVLKPETIDLARQEQSYGEDAVLLLPTRFGLGFMLDMPEFKLTPSGSLFGHPGAGGSIGFADPVEKIGFGYAMNKMIITRAPGKK